MSTLDEQRDITRIALASIADDGFALAGLSRDPATRTGDLGR